MIKNFGRGTRIHILVLLFLAATTLSLLNTGCSTGETKPPNIIFLLTDDQRWDALGAAGNDIIRTPNLDRLAEDGIMFNNAFVTTSICCCSRASILTGQYVSRHGINSFHTDLVGAALQNTYPLLLRNKAGYKTGFIGKYGIGLEQHPVNEYDYWTCEKMHQPHYEVEDEHGNYLHYTDKVQGDILSFLDQFGREGPFCLSVSFKAPHCEDGDPRQFIYNPRYKEMYADVEIPLPETADPKYWKQFPEDFRTNNEARKRWEIRFPDQEKHQESVRSYYRLVSGVDVVVGTIMDKLKALNVDDNTIIVFMGDNGFYLGEHGMAGKWYPHEEAIRVPFIIHDPRLPESKRGQKIENMALNIDVAPTILSLAGVEIPDQMQGSDVSPLYREKAGGANWREEFYYEHIIPIGTIPISQAVVDKEFKFITYPELESGFEEFYNLRDDPNEKVNLIDQSGYQEIIKDYKERLAQLREEVK